MVCGAKERIPKRIAILREYYQENVRQPGDLSPKEMKELVGHLEFDRFDQIGSLVLQFRSRFRSDRVRTYRCQSSLKVDLHIKL
jgi:hypothetical protein